MTDELIGCVQHDCAACKAAEAKVQRLEADARRLENLLGRARMHVFAAAPYNNGARNLLPDIDAAIDTNEQPPKS